MTKTWWILAVLAAVFTLVGLGLAAGMVLASGPPVLLFVGLPFLVIGLGMGAAVPSVRRQQRVGGDEDAMQDVAPLSEAPSAAQPWTQEQVAGELARVLAQTPYVVQQTAGRVRVLADLADARFLGFGGVRRVKDVVAHDVVVKGDGRCVTVDRVLGVDWSAGVDGELRPRLSGSGRTFSGKAWGKGMKVEYGVGADGSVGRQVAWTFDTRDVQQPVREVLDRAGWRTGWPAEAKVALAAAVIGGSAVVIVPVAFLVVWLTR